jgi:hypothetical protein
VKSPAKRHSSRQPPIPFSIVISSVYSMSLPTGAPMPVRVTLHPAYRVVAPYRGLRSERIRGTSHSGRITSKQEVIGSSVGLVPLNALVLTGVAKFGLVGCTESPAYDR